MTCLDVLFDTKKLLGSEIFELERIDSPLVLKAKFGSQTCDNIGTSWLFTV